MILDYKNFSNDLDIDQRTLEKYIYYLKEAFLLKKVYNYSTNLIKTERKLKKVYLESTSFCLNQKISGEIFENYILNTLDLEYFYRLGVKEVDFIGVQDKNTLNPILTGYEIKYKSKIKKQDILGLKHFDKKYPLEEKKIISKDFEGVIEGVDILPFWKV